MEIYTAAIIQQIQKTVSHRKEIKSVLTRYFELIDFLTNEGAAARKDFAPIKLIAFSEFFMQGLDRRWNLKKYLDDIAISIPGEEVGLLAEKAKDYGIYIAGAALEVDPVWKDRYFNTAFIIAPNGEVVHKYRKFVPTVYMNEKAMGPHDMYDEYVERYGESLDTFFPVVDTPIGKLGTMICMDGNFPEIARALAINGAEVIIRPTAYPGALVSSPLNYWEMQNRCRAWENHLYVVAPNTGAFAGDTPFPECQAPGHSMIVDYEGRLMAEIPHPGEGVISAVIDLDMLRRRRQDVNRNLLVQLKSEVFGLIYKEEIYPKNRCQGVPYQDNEDLAQRASLTPIIEKFFEKGIYTRPKGSND